MKDLTQFIETMSIAQGIVLGVIITVFVITWIMLIGELMKAKELQRESDLYTKLFEQQKQEHKALTQQIKDKPELID